MMGFLISNVKTSETWVPKGFNKLIIARDKRNADQHSRKVITVWCLTGGKLTGGKLTGGKLTGGKFYT